jgi:hypothetical protein
MPRKAACRKPSDPTQSDQVHAGEAVGVQDELAEGQARVQGDVHPAPAGIVLCGSVIDLHRVRFRIQPFQMGAGTKFLITKFLITKFLTHIVPNNKIPNHKIPK